MKSNIVRILMATAAMVLISSPATAQMPDPLNAELVDLKQPIVPLEDADYHIEAMTNQYAYVFWVDIPPNRIADYHIHTRDMACVVVSEYPKESYSQVIGRKPKPPRKPETGEVSYVHYYGQPGTHKTVNIGSFPMHSICATPVGRAPFGFTPLSRPEPYESVLDNERVTAWRLKLAPGAEAALLEQKGPGMRIVVGGGEIMETNAANIGRRAFLRDDHFYWQDAGKARSLRNVGTTTIEIVEFEFK